VADLQQQAEGHRFKSVVESKSPELFLVSVHWKFLPAFTKDFSRFFTKILKILFPRMSMNAKQGWMYVQRHTLYTRYTGNTPQTDKDHGMQWSSRMAGEMKMTAFQRVVMSLSWYTMLWTPPKFFWFCSWIYRKLLSSPLVGGFQYGLSSW